MLESAAEAYAFPGGKSLRACEGQNHTGRQWSVEFAMELCLCSPVQEALGNLRRVEVNNATARTRKMVGQQPPWMWWRWNNVRVSLKRWGRV